MPKAWCAKARRAENRLRRRRVAGRAHPIRRRSFHKSHDEAELVEIIEASAHRVTPRCAHSACAALRVAAPRPVGADRGQTKRTGVEPPTHRQRSAHGVAAALVRATLELSSSRAPVVALRHEERAEPRRLPREEGSTSPSARCEVLAEPVASLVGALADLLTGMARRMSIPSRGGAVRRRTGAGVAVLDPCRNRTWSVCAPSN